VGAPASYNLQKSALLLKLSLNFNFVKLAIFHKPKLVTHIFTKVSFQATNEDSLYRFRFQAAQPELRQSNGISPFVGEYDRCKFLLVDCPIEIISNEIFVS